MKKVIVLAALCASFYCTIHAQDNASGSELRLTLKEAVNNAMQYSKQLQTSKEDVEIYKEKIRETRAGILPQVSAGFGATTNFGKTLRFGEGMSLKTDAITFNGTASYLLSLQQFAAVKISKIASQIYETQDESTIINIKANITDTYYAILVYKRNIDILQENLKDLEDIQKHTEYTFEAGACEQTDVDQMKVTVSTLKNAINSTERSYETTKRLLVLQMGLPINTKIELTENLDDMITESTISAEYQNLDITQNVDYKSLELTNKVNEETLKMYKKAYIPTLNLAYQYTKNIKGGSPFSLEHTGTATLTIPLFQGFARDSRVKQAKLTLEKGKTNMDLLQDNLLQNEEQYRFELNSAIDAYLLQKENLEVAQRVLNNYKNKYEQGVLSSLDLTQANTNYLSAETSYASACLDLLMARTKLSKLYNNFEY